MNGLRTEQLRRDNLHHREGAGGVLDPPAAQGHGGNPRGSRGLEGALPERRRGEDPRLRAAAGGVRLPDRGRPVLDGVEGQEGGGRDREVLSRTSRRRRTFNPVLTAISP